MAVTNGITVQVPIVIEMTQEQAEEYAGGSGVALTAGAMSDDIRRHVLTGVQDSAAFGEGNGGRGASVRIKR